MIRQFSADPRAHEIYFKNHILSGRYMPLNYVKKQTRQDTLVFGVISNVYTLLSKYNDIIAKKLQLFLTDLDLNDPLVLKYLLFIFNLYRIQPSHSEPDLYFLHVNSQNISL
jgi:hypothetical protein